MLTAIMWTRDGEHPKIVFGTKWKRPQIRHSRETGCVKTTRGCRHGADTRIVIPAKAGIQGWGGANGRVSPPHPTWIPAFAGMTCLVRRCLGSFDTAWKAGIQGWRGQGSAAGSQ